jgi:myosin heavy subunit
MFPAGGADNMGKTRPKTAGTHFKEQVGVLMDTLAKSTPHYIRCIKPNSVKKGGVFEDALNMHQVCLLFKPSIYLLQYVWFLMMSL